MHVEPAPPVLDEGRFIRNIWYVAAWSHELEDGRPIGRTVAGEPLVLYRTSSGDAIALEDRCPHRHAPLSLGRVEGDDLRCLYHGLRFGPDGGCNDRPAGAASPLRIAARRFPTVETSSWIWVWTGDPARADAALVPTAIGLDNPDYAMRAGAMDYAADYQLINDNLCDLSHLDFVHQNTLAAASGASWATDEPKVSLLDNGVLIERWLRDHPMAPGSAQRVDTLVRYEFLLPGLFLMASHFFPVGTARDDFAAPTIPPLLRRVEQQAVTPIGSKRSRYLYASGVDAAAASPAFMDGLFSILNTAFGEDKAMIEAQQVVWDLTPPGRPKAFLPPDKAPAMLRRLINRRLAEENSILF